MIFAPEWIDPLVELDMESTDLDSTRFTLEASSPHLVVRFHGTSWRDGFPQGLFLSSKYSLIAKNYFQEYLF